MVTVGGTRVGRGVRVLYPDRLVLLLIFGMHAIFVSPFHVRAQREKVRMVIPIR